MKIIGEIMLIRLRPDDVRAFVICVSTERVWLEKCGRDTAIEAVTALVDQHLSPFMEVSDEVQQNAFRLCADETKWSNT